MIERLLIRRSGNRLVFVDGVYAPSSLGVRPEDGVVVANLAAAGPTRRAHRAAAAAVTSPSATTSFARAQYRVSARRRSGLSCRATVGRRPVHLLFIATQEGAASYPRCLVVAESGSR